MLKSPLFFAFLPISKQSAVWQFIGMRYYHIGYGEVLYGAFAHVKATTYGWSLFVWCVVPGHLACRPVGSANVRAVGPSDFEPGEGAVKARESARDGPGAEQKSSLEKGLGKRVWIRISERA